MMTGMRMTARSGIMISAYDCEGTTGSQSILPKSQVRIKTQLGWTDNENWQAVEAYTLELDKNSDSMADYKADGTDIIVNTHDKTGGTLRFL